MLLGDYYAEPMLNEAFKPFTTYLADGMSSLYKCLYKCHFGCFLSRLSRYLDDLLNIDNPYFEGMVNQIYPPELRLNKANTADTEAPSFYR